MADATTSSRPEQSPTDELKKLHWLRRLAVFGLTAAEAAELAELERKAVARTEPLDMQLRDYLNPGGLYPYELLTEHLESGLATGRTVYLWSVPGFMMLAGHPGFERPWSDGQGVYYRTAADALNRKNGRLS
jgi:hypothetical protein